MTIKKYLSTIIDITIFLLFLTSLALILTGNLMLAVVEGTSMEPLLQTGDIVIVTKVNIKDIKPGDVIVYEKYRGTYVIHRVMEVKVSNGRVIIITKGDNNSYYDPPITSEKIIGKVLAIGDAIVKIPALGFISLWFKSILIH
ncbi:MAG TPA: signal peptidase I [Acidilobales archaeon]|nr:signal peptidase I [Acidilobales archaeon]